MELLTDSQALSYLELFSGEANVFAAVKEEFTGTAVDIEYLQRVPHAGGARGNAFDLNSHSGLGWPSCRGNLHEFACEVIVASVFRVAS